MSYNLTYVRVALATLDVQNILEIPATDEIHMKDRNHGLAWTRPNNGLYNTQHATRNTQHATQSRALRVKSYIWILWYQNDQRRNNLHIELQKHKLDQIAARNIRISLDKRIAFSK